MLFVTKKIELVANHSIHQGVFKEMNDMCEEPIFEIVDGDKHYKLWQNGKAEGFSKYALIINRIQMKIDSLEAKLKALENKL